MSMRECELIKCHKCSKIRTKGVLASYDLITLITCIHSHHGNISTKTEKMSDNMHSHVKEFICTHVRKRVKVKIIHLAHRRRECFHGASKPKSNVISSSFTPVQINE